MPPNEFPGVSTTGTPDEVAPYRLWVLTSESATDAERLEVINDFLASPRCCLGWVGARLRDQFPSAEALSSGLAKLVVMSWMRSLVFSIYACEREHASMRRLIGGAGPARNFSLVVRERILEATRNIHTERGGTDPRIGVDDATSKRQRLLGEGMPGETQANPCTQPPPRYRCTAACAAEEDRRWESHQQRRAKFPTEGKRWLLCCCLWGTRFQS